MIVPLTPTMRVLTASRLLPYDVLDGLRRGEARAVGEVYDDHHQALRAFAVRLVGDEAQAEDLVHEVFVSLPKAIASFRGESSLRTFLIGIAVNHARHHVRSAARRRSLAERAQQEPLATTAATPEQELEARNLLSLIDAALDELPLEQRVAFVLCDVEERSSQEAATITNAPEATVRTRLRQARLKLREVLEQAGVR
jgi:RNA polymerase sigma-70 factor, ECF subfamily